MAISAWSHYRAVEGPLQSALLSLYVLIAVLPALLVMEEYLDARPDSLANSLVRHYHLNAPTATMIHGVLDAGSVPTNSARRCWRSLAPCSSDWASAASCSSCTRGRGS